MDKIRLIVLVVVVATIAAGIWYLESQKVDIGSAVDTDSVIEIDSSGEVARDKEGSYERAYEISTPDGFINTDEIAIGDLIGEKVILVDFWTYSCINCQRTTPYLNAWYDKYRDQGLEIIGIHTPEFEFEKKYENVQRAVEQFGIEFPVVLDNDYSTWQSYKNRYWPRKYLIDIDGFIVYDHIGEGAYEETEREIQAALAERMERLDMDAALDDSVVHLPGDASNAASPEIYFGALRNDRFGSGIPGETGTLVFPEPETVEQDTLYLVGEWDIQEEYAEAVAPGARVIFHYSATKVHIVAGSDSPAQARLLIDGETAVTSCGLDACQAKDLPAVTVSEERLYNIISHPAGRESRTLEIIVDDPGIRFFTFTFG